MKIKKEIIIGVVGLGAVIAGYVLWNKKTRKQEIVAIVTKSVTDDGTVVGNDTDGWFVVQGGGRYTLANKSIKDTYVARKIAKTKPMTKVEFETIPLVGTVSSNNLALSALKK